MAASTTVRIEERDGRIFISFYGPEKYALCAALWSAFPGHKQLYRLSSGRHAGGYRLWARDRERLCVWLEVWCQASSVTWTGGEAAGLRPGLPNEQAR
jgi:hypothetical protein